jgi:hypothetical protein
MGPCTQPPAGASNGKGRWWRDLNLANLTERHITVDIQSGMCRVSP